MTEMLEMLIYQLERPDGTVLAWWALPSYLNFTGGFKVDGDGVWVGAEFVRPPWILRGRRGAEASWLTLAERSESMGRTTDGDQGA